MRFLSEERNREGHGCKIICNPGVRMHLWRSICLYILIFVDSVTGSVKNWRKFWSDEELILESQKIGVRSFFAQGPGHFVLFIYLFVCLFVYLFLWLINFCATWFVSSWRVFFLCFTANVLTCRTGEKNHLKLCSWNYIQQVQGLCNPVEECCVVAVK